MQVTWTLGEQCLGNQTAPMSVPNRERNPGSIQTCTGVKRHVWFSLSDDCNKIEQPTTPPPYHPVSFARWLTCLPPGEYVPVTSLHSWQILELSQLFPQKATFPWGGKYLDGNVVGSPGRLGWGIQPLTLPLFNRKQLSLIVSSPSNKIRPLWAAILNRPALDTCCSRRRTGNIKGGMLPIGLDI